MKVEITNGIVLIDAEDLELISQYKWHVNDMGYAVWRGIKDGVKQTIRMHRIINNTPANLHTDHINHNRLDNHRSNLRTVTASQNMRNKTNQGKGYNLHRQTGNWTVETYGFRMGGFKTEEEAERVVAIIRNGGTYQKPSRTHCIYGHSLNDAYDYGKGKRCKTCQSVRSKKYFKRSYIPKPRLEVLVCPRGHDKTITKTKNGDCRECVKLRAALQRRKYANA